MSSATSRQANEGWCIFLLQFLSVPVFLFLMLWGQWELRRWAWDELHLFQGASELRSLGDKKLKENPWQLLQVQMGLTLWLAWLPTLNHSSPGLESNITLSTPVYAIGGWSLLFSWSLALIHCVFARYLSSPRRPFDKPMLTLQTFLS